MKMVIVIIIIMWVLQIILLLVFIPITFHKSVYILRASIVFSPSHCWVKNIAVKGLKAEGEISVVLQWERDANTV